MTDPNSQSAPDALDTEAIATARLVLPLVLTRLESDPKWSLAMLDAVTVQLTKGQDIAGAAATDTAALMLELSAGKALAQAHALAVKDELVAATAFARLALRDPDALGDKLTNAMLLLASLLERQGDLVEAAKVVAKACEEDPGHTNAQADRTRIVDALRAKANAIPTDQKAEKAAMFAQVISTGGWSFADAKNLFFASSGLMRG